MLETLDTLFKISCFIGFIILWCSSWALRSERQQPPDGNTAPDLPLNLHVHPTVVFGNGVLTFLAILAAALLIAMHDAHKHIDVGYVMAEFMVLFGSVYSLIKNLVSPLLLTITPEGIVFPRYKGTIVAWHEIDSFKIIISGGIYTSAYYIVFYPTAMNAFLIQHPALKKLRSRSYNDDVGIKLAAPLRETTPQQLMDWLRQYHKLYDTRS